jgi:uncharacterized membrane protein
MSTLVVTTGKVRVIKILVVKIRSSSTYRTFRIWLALRLKFKRIGSKLSKAMLTSVLLEISLRFFTKPPEVIRKALWTDDFTHKESLLFFGECS